MKTLRASLALLLIFFTSDLTAAKVYKIVIKKSERKLYLYRSDSLVKTYPIALGLTPIGRKEKQGDYKTPEGEYFICSKNDHNQFYLSLGVSYPNIQDAERGLKAGLISRNQYRQIRSAIAHHHKPPMNTRLGGDLMALAQAMIGPGVA